MNPELKDFLTEWDSKWASLPPGSGPADRRAHFEVVAQEMRLPTPAGVDCTQTREIDSPAGPVRVRIFRHEGSAPQPCLIYMHGGAWMQGSPETHWDITSRIAAWNGQTVVSVDYAKSPERPFPAAFEQVCAVARWVAAEGAEIGVDPARLTIGGDSAGGNLAAAAALHLRGEVDFAGQLLIYPACDFSHDRPSYRENPDGPIVRVADMPKVDAMYCPDDETRSTDPRVAPLVASDHSGLPPAYVAVAEFDPLRDSGVAYAEALETAGVPVHLDRGPGLIHGYLRAMNFCTDAMKGLENMARWLAERNRAAQ